MNLKELSARLGLSQTTVSRALNGYPEVSEKTRKRVVEAAERFHYRPNARAQRLATGRAMAIAHVIPAAMHGHLSNLVFADFISGAGEIYSTNGYDMLVSIVSDADELQAYRDLVGRQAVDGAILHGPRVDDPRIPLLAELGLPFVVHGRSTRSTAAYNWLDVNNRRALERATAYLVDLGHRRIALVNGEETLDFAVRRREGYLAALTRAGIAEDTSIMASGDMTEPLGFGAAREMLTLDDPPSAFVCSSIVPTFGVRRAIEAAGLRLGQDISVVCFDDDIGALPNGSPDAPTYTATRSSVRAAGRRCAEILLAQIAGEADGFVQELWEADLLLGQSTGVWRAGAEMPA